MKIDIFNSDWDELEELPIKQKTKKKNKIIKEDENSSKKDNYNKDKRKNIDDVLF